MVRESGQHSKRFSSSILISISRSGKQFKSAKMTSGKALHTPAKTIHDCPAIFQRRGSFGVFLSMILC